MCSHVTMSRSTAMSTASGQLNFLSSFGSSSVASVSLPSKQHERWPNVMMLAVFGASLVTAKSTPTIHHSTTAHHQTASAQLQTYPCFYTTQSSPANSLQHVLTDPTTPMSSHTPGMTIHPYPEFSDPRHANPPTCSPANPSHHRVRTYTAHALILFNVYGVPLSSGIWLEYCFTSLHPSHPLLSISAIFGAQFACLGFAIGVTASLYRRWPGYWRLQMFLGGLSVCVAHLGLVIASNLWVTVLCQGVLTGLGLGVSGTVSVMVLSTHYKHNLAVASTQCVGAGFFGAIVYTLLTWMCLRTDNVKLGHGVTLVLLSLTLVPAVLVARPSAMTKSSRARQSPPNMSTVPRAKRPSFLALLTTLALSPALPLPPLLSPLLLSRHPTPHRADTGSYFLFALSGAALLSSTLIPRTPPHRLAPTTLLTASTFLAGISVVPLIWMRILYVAVPCAAVFGVGLGGVCAVWVEALAALVEGGGGEGLGWWVCVLVAVGGVGAGGGIMGAAAVLSRMESGVEIVMGVMSGCLVLGGLMVGAGADVKYWAKKENWSNR